MSFAELLAHRGADVVVADGGSTDGSLTPEIMAAADASALLVKTGPGKLSAQMRMGLAWCMERAYEGCVIIDGNGKDGVEAVAAMVAFNRPNAKTHSGVWRDLWVRRRRTEVDVQIAPIATIGAKHGLPCPAVRALVAMTHECEAGTRPMSDANLTELLP